MQMINDPKIPLETVAVNKHLQQSIQNFGYKISMQNLIALLYTNDQWSEKEIREITPSQYPQII